MNENRIERSVDLKSAPSKVWKALTDHKQFDQWFSIRLNGPFAVGTTVAGNLTFEGMEHVSVEFTVTALEPESRFAYKWHPGAIDPSIDYSKEPETLVEFTLMPQGSGTKLTVVETGFEKIPGGRRLEAFRMNTEGWVGQLEALVNYVG